MPLGTTAARSRLPPVASLGRSRASSIEDQTRHAASPAHSALTPMMALAGAGGHPPSRVTSPAGSWSRFIRGASRFRGAMQMAGARWPPHHTGSGSMRLTPAKPCTLCGNVHVPGYRCPKVPSAKRPLVAIATSTPPKLKKLAIAAAAPGQTRLQAYLSPGASESRRDMVALVCPCLPHGCPRLPPACPCLPPACP